MKLINFQLSIFSQNVDVTTRPENAYGLNKLWMKRIVCLAKNTEWSIQNAFASLTSVTPIEKFFLPCNGLIIS